MIFFSDLFHLVSYPQGLSMSKMVGFNSSFFNG